MMYPARSFLQRAAGAIGNVYTSATHTATGGYGRTAAGALWGAAVGGVYGAMSDNTSILGGAMKGASIGAVGARYGAYGISGALGAKAAGRGARIRGFGHGIANQIHNDYKGARMMANKAYTKIRGIF